jgi:hypothetical protein
MALGTATHGSGISPLTSACRPFLQVAPVFTLMERELLAKMGRLLGGEYAAACDGLFVPGGSLSTIYSLLLARCVTVCREHSLHLSPMGAAADSSCVWHPPAGSGRRLAPNPTASSRWQSRWWHSLRPRRIIHILRQPIWWG